MTVTELVVGLENEPGRLTAVVQALKGAEIEVLALAVAGTKQAGEARILIDNPRKARSVLMTLDVPARTEEALVIESDFVGHEMLEALEPLSREGVNITHLLAFPTVSQSVVLAMCLSDTKLGIGVLQEHGFDLLDLPRLLTRFRGDT